MQFIEVNRDNADILFDYWNEIGKNIPYFYRTAYKLFIKSLFDDTYEGITIFRTNNVFVVQEDGQVKGFIQYGIPTFHFTEAGKITEDINKGYRYLHTDTALNNKIAQKFYIRNEFIDSGITRSYLTKRSS